MSSKTFRPYNPNQQFLMPPSMRDWLSEDHLAYFVSDTVDEMDLSEIEGVYERNLAGYPPYHPRMMVKVLVYAYCTGVFSSRKMAKRLDEDVAFRVLAAGNRPDFRTISDFRKLHLAALKKLFLEVLRLCRQAGLEAEAKEAAKQESPEVDSSNDDPKPAKRGRPKKPPSGVPEDKAQKNFTDPESRIMLSAEKSFIQGYNAQAAVDSEYQVVVAAMVTNQAADSVHVEAMVERIEENTGELPDQMSLDAGYYSDANVQHLESKKIDVYMPPMRLKHREYREAKPEPVTDESTTRERMRSKVLTDEGRAKYSLRKETVEPVFGQIKRCMGFREFSMRGEEACEAEWNLVCACHNLLKLFKYGASGLARQAQEYAAAGLGSNALAVAA